MLGDPITELTAAMELTVKIPGRELALAKKFSSEHTVIDFVCEVKDEIGGNTVTNLRDNVDVKLSDATAAELTKRPIEYSTGFTLTPGRYSIKFLARDDETGRIGTYQTSFTIPNLNNEAKKLPISSVVISNQRIDTKSALFNTIKSKDQIKNDAVDPLVNSEGKLIPSVTRVFRKDREMEVLLQAYQGDNAASTTALPPYGPIVAYVTLFREDKKTIETQAAKAEPIAEDNLGTTTIRIRVPLSGMQSGEYEVQVTALDAITHRIAVWRTFCRLARVRMHNGYVSCSARSLHHASLC